MQKTRRLAHKFQNGFSIDRVVIYQIKFPYKFAGDANPDVVKRGQLTNKRETQKSITFV